MRQLVVAVTMVSALVSCGPVSRAEQVAALTGTASAGENLYKTNCTSCHGTSGQGTSSGVELVSHVKEHSPAALLEIIINGKTGTNMSAYGVVFSDQQLADLFAYMKATFAP